MALTREQKLRSKLKTIQNTLLSWSMNYSNNNDTPVHHALLHSHKLVELYTVFLEQSLNIYEKLSSASNAVKNSSHYKFMDQLIVILSAGDSQDGLLLQCKKELARCCSQLLLVQEKIHFGSNNDAEKLQCIIMRFKEIPDIAAYVNTTTTTSTSQSTFTTTTDTNVVHPQTTDTPLSAQPSDSSTAPADLIALLQDLSSTKMMQQLLSNDPTIKFLKESIKNINIKIDYNFLSQSIQLNSSSISQNSSLFYQSKFDSVFTGAQKELENKSLQKIQKINNQIIVQQSMLILYHHLSETLMDREFWKGTSRTGKLGLDAVSGFIKELKKRFRDETRTKENRIKDCLAFSITYQGSLGFMNDRRIQVLRKILSTINSYLINHEFTLHNFIFDKTTPLPNNTVLDATSAETVERISQYWSMFLSIDTLKATVLGPIHAARSPLNTALSEYTKLKKQNINNTQQAEFAQFTTAAQTVCTSLLADLFLLLQEIFFHPTLWNGTSIISFKKIGQAILDIQKKFTEEEEKIWSKGYSKENNLALTLDLMNALKSLGQFAKDQLSHLFANFSGSKKKIGDLFGILSKFDSTNLNGEVYVISNSTSGIEQLITFLEKATTDLRALVPHQTPVSTLSIMSNSTRTENDLKDTSQILSPRNQ